MKWLATTNLRFRLDPLIATNFCHFDLIRNYGELEKFKWVITTNSSSLSSYKYEGGCIMCGKGWSELLVSVNLKNLHQRVWFIITIAMHERKYDTCHNSALFCQAWNRNKFTPDVVKHRFSDVRPTDITDISAGWLGDMHDFRHCWKLNWKICLQVWCEHNRRTGPIHFWGAHTFLVRFARILNPAAARIPPALKTSLGGKGGGGIRQFYILVSV